MTDLVKNEYEHRRSMWQRLAEHGGPREVAPAHLRELGIYGGAQGIWVDKTRTGLLTEDRVGVTVGLLHTGSSYPDDLSENGVLYHYPKTNRATGRDASEVASTKAAGQLGLPLFVISYPSPTSTKRSVDLGWVEGWDDEAELFLITFADSQPALLTKENEEEPFALFGEDESHRREVSVRKGQQRFKFRLLQRYGPQCAVCGMGIVTMLDAAHIGSKKERGSDDPRNGLVLCPNHHRAFDAGLFAVNPASLNLHFKDGGPNAAALHITCSSLTQLRLKPHRGALEWRWQRWKSKPLPPE